MSYRKHTLLCVKIQYHVFYCAYLLSLLAKLKNFAKLKYIRAVCDNLRPFQNTSNHYYFVNFSVLM